MISFGETIRKIREEKGLLLRQAAAFLETDTAFVSKIERGERKTNREHVEKLAQFLQTDKDQLITIWLADKILEMIKDNKQGESALNLALKEFHK